MAEMTQNEKILKDLMEFYGVKTQVKLAKRLENVDRSQITRIKQTGFNGTATTRIIIDLLKQCKRAGRNFYGKE